VYLVWEEEYPRFDRSHRFYMFWSERLEDIGLENSKSALDRIGNIARKWLFSKEGKQNVLVNKIPIWDNNPR
jgi:hypothetical protein